MMCNVMTKLSNMSHIFYFINLNDLVLIIHIMSNEYMSNNDISKLVLLIMFLHYYNDCFT